MLIKHRILEQIAQGTIDLAFRRWKRPTVKPGGQLRTEVGVLAIDSIAVIDLEDITEKEALRAGYSSREALIRELSKNSEGELYRIQLHLAEQDPRLLLREEADLSEEALNDIRRQLVRLDGKNSDSHWTMTVLRLIQEYPGVRAAELAEKARMETQTFKLKVRKLKELGLTESILKGGYRLSPRGERLLQHLMAQ